MVTVKELKRMKGESDRQYRHAMRELKPRKWPGYLAMFAASAVIGYYAHYIPGYAVSKLEQVVQDMKYKLTPEHKKSHYSNEEPAHSKEAGTHLPMHAAEITDAGPEQLRKFQPTGHIFIYGKAFNAHEVREGETIASIAEAYGKDPNSLYSYNKRWNRWFTPEPGAHVLLEQLE